MIVNFSVEIDEQEGGTYVFPYSQDSNKEKYSWAMYVFLDGSADIYTKRNEKNGALLGKPIRLPALNKKTGGLK